MWWSRCRTADTPRRSPFRTIKPSAAAAAARPPPPSRTRTSSTNCSSPIRTIRCCVFRIAANCIGSRFTSCPRLAAARAASPSSICCPFRKASASAQCCRSRNSKRENSFSWPRVWARSRRLPWPCSRGRARAGSLPWRWIPATSWCVAITDGTRDILLFTTAGKAIRFLEEEVRPMGREAAGVRGVKLIDDQRVNALIVAQDGFILTASQNGFGKLTPLGDFPKHGRGGQGVIALQITDRNGTMVGALQVSLDDEIMLMSQNGVLVRTPVKDISIVGRNTQGVRLIRLEDGDQLSGLERIEGLAGEGGAEADAAGPDASGPDAANPAADDS